MDPGLSSTQTRALWWTAPGRAELKPLSLVPKDDPRWVEVRARFGAVSAGTERLVGSGHVPAALSDSMACAHMEGAFPFPVKYGYSVVGEIASGSDRGKRVFAMHPHQERFWALREELVDLPESVPDRRAALFPNMETALNAVWDGELRPGERVAVVGHGVVGALVAHLAAGMPGVKVDVVEPDTARRSRFDGRAVSACAELQKGAYDVVFHCTGSPASLQGALDLVGAEGRLVELSWYGDKGVPLALGLDFHHGRKRIIGSQVGNLPPALRGRWDRARRREAVLSFLEDPALFGLFSMEVPFVELPAFMEKLVAGSVPGFTCLVRY